jgi:hypothetical protein
VRAWVVSSGHLRESVVRSCRQRRSLQCLVGLRQLYILGVKDFTERVSPALCKHDPRLLRLLRIGAIAVALQYGLIRPVQAKRDLEVLGRAAGIVREADLVLFSHDWPEVGRLHLTRPGMPGLSVAPSSPWLPNR